MAQVQQDTAPLGLGGIAFRKTPVGSPLPDVMADLGLESEDVSEVEAGEGAHGWVVAQHEAHHGPFGDGPGRPMDGLHLLPAPGQGLLGVKRPSLLGAEVDQLEPDGRCGGDHHRGDVFATRKGLGTEAAPGNQLDLSSEAGQIGCMAAPDGASPDHGDNATELRDHHPEKPPSTLMSWPVM